MDRQAGQKNKNPAPSQVAGFFDRSEQAAIEPY